MKNAAVNRKICMMQSLVEYMKERAAHFSICDWAIFKTCLVSFGMLLGAALSRAIKKLAPVMAVIFVISWGYMVWRVFFAENGD